MIRTFYIEIIQINIQILNKFNLYQQCSYYTSMALNTLGIVDTCIHTVIVDINV